MQAKNKMREFASFHPSVNFIYFFAVIGFSMFFMNPVCLLISFVCATVYSVMLSGRRAAFFNLFFLIPVILITAIMNPAFNHEGETVIAYLPSGNQLTLESMVYGVAAGTMLAGVICWFSCFNKIMTSDKFVYLFGRVMPSFSLVLSMTLRFVPHFKNQFKNAADAQRGIGRGYTEGGFIKRAKCALTILSIMITWALENAVETSDSMKSRGYGTSKRTAFSIFSLTRRDIFALVFLICDSAYIIAAHRLGGAYYRYFPSIKFDVSGGAALGIFTAYMLLCLLPVFIEIKEALRWK